MEETEIVVPCNCAKKARLKETLCVCLLSEDSGKLGEGRYCGHQELKVGRTKGRAGGGW